MSIALGVLFAFLAQPDAWAGEPADAIRSVVSVLPQWQGRPPNANEPEGSGVVIADGRLVLTASHVLGNARQVQIRTRDGEIIDADIIARDKATDLALLRSAAALTPLEFAGDPNIGDRACAIGNAFGLGLSMTCGFVSAVHGAGVGFNAVEDYVQTDAAVNPGASGGALVDADGRLIGVLSAIFTKQSDANIGVNFAVSAPLAARVADDLSRNGSVRWNFAGLDMRAFPPKGGSGREAAEVVRLRAGSEGEQAGLEPGDYILHAGSRRIRKPKDMQAALARLRPGDKIELVIMRQGAETRLDLKLER